jgi:hypothetical protein
MAKWRKKPIVIDAIQWSGENKLEILSFCGNNATFEKNIFDDEEELFIGTLEGTMKASINDYIIKGVNGEFYPCKPSIFAKTYDLVIEDNSLQADNREHFVNK